MSDFIYIGLATKGVLLYNSNKGTYFHCFPCYILLNDVLGSCMYNIPVKYFSLLSTVLWREMQDSFFKRLRTGCQQMCSFMS